MGDTNPKAVAAECSAKPKYIKAATQEINFPAAPEIFFTVPLSLSSSVDFLPSPSPSCQAFYAGQTNKNAAKQYHRRRFGNAGRAWCWIAPWRHGTPRGMRWQRIRRLPPHERRQGCERDADRHAHDRLPNRQASGGAGYCSAHASYGDRRRRRLRLGVERPTIQGHRSLAKKVPRASSGSGAMSLSRRSNR